MSLTKSEKISFGVAVFSAVVAGLSAMFSGYQVRYAYQTLNSAQKFGLQHTQIGVCERFLIAFKEFEEEFKRQESYRSKREEFRRLLAENSDSHTSVIAFGFGFDFQLFDPSSEKADLLLGMNERIKKIYGSKLAEKAKNFTNSMRLLSIYSGGKMSENLERSEQDLFNIFNRTAFTLALPESVPMELAPDSESLDELWARTERLVKGTIDTCRDVMLGQKLDLL